MPLTSRLELELFPSLIKLEKKQEIINKHQKNM